MLRSRNNTARQGRLAQGDLCGTGDHSIKKNKDQNTNRNEKARGWAIVKRGVRTHQHTFFWRRVSVVHLWRQRSSDQDDNLRTKSDDETYFQNPQSCSWLVVWQNQLGPPNLNQICWHRTSTCRHSDLGSPSKNEWNHLLWLLNRRNFSAISLRLGARIMIGAVSKRGQNTTSDDGSPTAKARPVNLVMRSQYKEETSSSSLGCRVNPDMTMKEKESAKHQETGCSVIQKSEVENSQVSRQEKVPQTARKIEQMDQTQVKSEENPPGTRKLAACSPEFRNMEYTHHRYIDKIFQKLKKKQGMSAINATFSMDAYKTNVLTW